MNIYINELTIAHGWANIKNYLISKPSKLNKFKNTSHYSPLFTNNINFQYILGEFIKALQLISTFVL
jgi:hypothetical protein